MQLQAIAAWAEAEAKHSERASLPFAGAHAVEVGAWMLPTLTQPPGDEDESPAIQVSQQGGAMYLRLCCFYLIWCGCAAAVCMWNHLNEIKCHALI